MMASYLSRTIEPVLERAAKEFPVVVLTGPRQSGKTTLLTHLFGERYRYVSLEPPDIRAAAISDPRGFLALYPPPVIYDEVQYIPELLMYIKEIVDARRDLKGQFLLTGSQNLMVLEGVNESLAGRTAVLHLLPLSMHEMAGRPQTRPVWELPSPEPPEHSWSYPDLWQNFLRGSYPELVANPERDTSLWYAGYVQTYLERDVRTLRQVGDLTQFQNFLRALTARNAQLLNMTELARDLGLAVNTVKAWISVLQAGMQIVLLRPYFVNAGKRLVKTPKVYFTDTGTLCYLAGLRTAQHAAAGPMGGAILETAVMAELIKDFIHRGQEPPIYFWRTTAGAEVDFIIEQEGKLIPIEVKLSATPKPRMAEGIAAFQKDYGDRVGKGYVVHLGEMPLPLGHNVTALPFGQF